MAIRITKVYTRVGDKGDTHLAGGMSVRKDDARVEAYGTVDELNASVGMAVALLRDAEGFDDAVRVLQSVQQRLFDVGAELATPAEQFKTGMPAARAEDVEALEKAIDAMNENLAPLTSFILPGGGVTGAALHQARTVCRRAERRTVTLADSQPVGAQTIPYLNRLSDYLFVLARHVAAGLGEAETLWERDRPR